MMVCYRFTKKYILLRLTGTNSSHNFSKTVNNEHNYKHDCKMECCVIEFLNHQKYNRSCKIKLSYALQ